MHTWLDKLVMDNNADVNEKVKKYVSYLAYNYIDTVCGFSGGMTGKKQMEMHRFYNEINELVYKEKGHELVDLPEETYRYIVTCLEYMGFRREPSMEIQIVDVSGITNNDLLFDGSI